MNFAGSLVDGSLWLAWKPWRPSRTPRTYWQTEMGYDFVSTSSADGVTNTSLAD